MFNNYVMVDLDSFAGTNPVSFEFNSRINIIYFTVDQTLSISDKKEACVTSLSGPMEKT